MSPELWHKLRFLLRRRASNDELDEEMRLHLDLRAAKYMESGKEARVAYDSARRAFGNRTRLKEISREMHGFTRVGELARNLRHSFRLLRKSPGFTTVAILSLALGIAANTSVYSFVRAIVFKTLPVASADRLVVLRQQNEMFHIENCCFPHTFVSELRRQDRDFEDILELKSTDVNLSDQEQSERVTAEIVSGNYFRMLGVRAETGRLLDESDDRIEGGGRVCVIGYRLWQKHFGGRADVVGRRVELNAQPFQIVGVTERGFAGASLHNPRELQVPTSATRILLGDNRGIMGWSELIARLKPGVAPEQAAARLNVLGPQIEKVSGPQMSARDAFIVGDGSQGVDSRKEQFGKPVLLLLLLVAVVLLVACTNLAALLLVRSVERTREAGLRMALGASSAAMFRQFIVESLLLAAMGGVAGWIMSGQLTHVLLSLLGPVNEGLAYHLHPDASVFAFLAAVTLLAGILFGTLPAWRASNADPFRAIQGVGVVGAGRRSLTSRLLIAGQIALSLGLIFTAGLFARTLHNLRSIDLGFRPENVALLHINLGKTKYAQSGASQYFEELLRRARELPETRVASLASISVLSGSMHSVSLEVPGYVPPNRVVPVTYFMAVSDGYFRTLGLPLLAGRDFTGNDRAGSEGVAIVNEQFARKFFAGNALGKTFSYGNGRKVRIAGVSGTGKFRWIREQAEPQFYVPVTQGTFPQALYLQVRTAGEPSATMARLMSLVREMDPLVPPDSITTMEMQIDQALGRERLLAFLSVFLGSLAVGLATIGLYGVLSFSVVRRTREIGIRIAAGAPRTRILGLFLAESAWIVSGGIALGIPLALGCGRLATSLLYGLTPQDAATAAIATLLLALAGFGAALIPAWRAARLDAVVALRYE